MSQIASSLVIPPARLSTSVPPHPLATRARAALRVSTERGSLQPLAPILDRVGLELAPSLGGFFTSPAHTLHPAGVIPWPECANQASLLLLTHTHSHLAMLASLLRSVLPADSTFQLETK